MSRTIAHGTVALIGLLAMLPASPAQAQTLPGPPPRAGLDLPSAPGTALGSVPAGTPATLGAGASAPALVDGNVTLSGRRFSLVLACHGRGRLTVTAPGVVGGTVAAGRYRCAHGRATVRLTAGRTTAGRLERHAPVTAQVTLAHTRLTFLLGAHRSAPAFWTDGHLQCGPQSFLVEPDFTTRAPTEISTRGWIAWEPATGGWHWLGDGRWDAWTATATGIAQFHPGGAVQPTPWTWGPITAPAGAGIRAVGVYEIVYWVGGRPVYRWEYVNAGTTGAAAAGSGTLACTLP
ncbi:MAG TPA: hypothetical protein VNS09_16930 [Solirubrobacter sp.]|nr:hypothetical protein [Solirubrobacter sp.]